MAEGLVIIHKVTHLHCHNAKKLPCVGLHWHVPFIEDCTSTLAAS